MTCILNHVLVVVVLMVHSQSYVRAFLAAPVGYQGPLCVCSQHQQLFIYPVAATNVLPIGALYTGDCKMYEPNTGPVGKFLPVIHEHQIGYVYKDAEVSLSQCPNFVVDPSDKLTTSITSLSHATTTSSPTQTTHHVVNPATPTSRPSGCNSLALFTEIAYHKNVGLQNYPRCLDNIHYDSDAIIVAFCSAPDPSVWLPGKQVTTHCNQLSQYAPIAVFDQHASYQDSAAILLECHNNYIYVATQSCIRGLHIQNVSISSKPSSSAFHVIEWP